jgi:hypothetical protein
MTIPTYEIRFTMAIETIQSFIKLSIRVASKFYNIKRATLYDRFDD